MKESPQALDAFTRYRDLGPDRSLDAVARQCMKSVSLLRRWSAEHAWGDRARQHDEAIAAEAAVRDKAARLADLDRRRDKRLKVALDVRQAGIDALLRLDIDTLAGRAQDIVKMFDYADKTERLDLGEATERTEIATSDDNPLTELARRIARLADGHGSPGGPR